MTNPPVTHERVEEIRRAHYAVSDSGEGHHPNNCAKCALLSAYDQVRETEKAALKALEPFAAMVAQRAVRSDRADTDIIFISAKFGGQEYREITVGDLRRAAELTGRTKT